MPSKWRTSVANDSVTTGNSFTHTKTQNNTWWQVDLPGGFDVQKVILHNRLDCLDCYLERSEGAIVSVLIGTDGNVIALMPASAGSPSACIQIATGSSYA